VKKGADVTQKNLDFCIVHSVNFQKPIHNTELT